MNDKKNNYSDIANKPANKLEGRNVILEAFRSGMSIDKIFIQEGLTDGSLAGIIKKAREKKIPFSSLSKERLDKMSESGRHQGVIAYAAAYAYSSIEEVLDIAKRRDENPFIIILDGIEDPHNLGAIIRSANMAGAHGVIIPKRRASGLTPVVARASAGALMYTPVVRVTNISDTIDTLKSRGMWFVCASPSGRNMYDIDMKGSIGLVVGNEGCGVSRLVSKKCDFHAAIPTCGDIDSLNASVAAGILAFEIHRQRMGLLRQ